jgi:hypothetical protein
MKSMRIAFMESGSELSEFCYAGPWQEGGNSIRIVQLFGVLIPFTIMNRSQRIAS